MTSLGKISRAIDRMAETRAHRPMYTIDPPLHIVAGLHSACRCSLFAARRHHQAQGYRVVASFCQHRPRPLVDGRRPGGLQLSSARLLLVPCVCAKKEIALEYK